MVIGLLGGMGSYATLDFFERYLNKFKAEKEWDRPRILIDNRCTMPSRVRAILFNENWDIVVEEITDSIANLVNAGCDHIILACNTSHVFLPDVFTSHPEFRTYVLDIIEQCALDIKLRGITEIFLIATEGTILSHIYQDVFQKVGIKVNVPEETIFEKMRYFIEIVKTNNYTSTVLDEFEEFLIENTSMPIVLGCTEFPVIFNKIRERDSIKILPVYDPLESTLNYLYSKFVSTK